MPTSIPSFNTSLVLGSVVDPSALGLLRQIQSCETKIGAAQEKMTSLMAMKRSTTMTINELVDMGIDVDAAKKKLIKLDAEISSAASDYITARIDNETTIQSLQTGLNEMFLDSDTAKDYASLQSPVDFGATKIAQLPLASESIKLDSQFFSFGGNLQSETLANVERFVRDSTSDLGAHSNDLSSAVSRQLSNQYQNHSISGTLIIAASCTHRTVALLDPLVIDPDKAVAAWNSVQADKINLDDMVPESAQLESEGGDSANSAAALHVVTGASYGSSFIGMIHILNSDSAQSRIDLDQLKANLEQRLSLGGWLQNTSGGFGVDDSAMQEAKSVLSSQEVSSHVGLIVLGAVPTLKSNELKLTLKSLAEFDPKLVSAIETSANRGPEETDTVASESARAINSKRILEIQNAKASGLLSAIDKIDHGENKALDINSLMSAFENYVLAVQSKDSIVGVPLQAHIRTLTKGDITSLWLNKYRKVISPQGKPVDS